MVAHGPSGVPSRPGVRLGDDVEQLKRLQIAVYNANAYQRRVAAKGAAGGAQPMTRPHGPPDRGAQAFARGAARCLSQVHGRSAQAVARGAAHRASHLLNRGAQASAQADACGDAMLSQQEKSTWQMSRHSKLYQLHLHRGKATQEPESLSDECSAGRVGRANVMRLDSRVRVTYAAATPAVRAYASTVKKMPFEKSPACARTL
jgi:hypothetical protein